MRVRTYSELRRIESFEDRYEYLRVGGSVGDITFGHERWLNQDFYRSYEWKRVRQIVIARDLARDLGAEGHEIHDRIIIHHMNPMTVEEIEHGDESIIDPEFLITTTHRTHNAIHYGDRSLLPQPLIVRRPGDTAPWLRR